MEKICNFDGCDRKFDSHGYCSQHAKQFRNGLELRPLRRRFRENELQEFCIFNGCDRKSKSLNLCGPHYIQSKRKNELTPVREVIHDCIVKECDEPHSARGYCVKHYRIFNTFKIPAQQYEDMLVAQNNNCAICKNTCSSGMRLSVDHDHATNEIRGLLCGKCNRGLGMYDDNIELLKSAIIYLESYS
jgi:hypothetical protein